MAKSNDKRFVLGNGIIPGWIEQFSRNGRIKFEYDEDKNIISATIHSQTGVKKAIIGDTIVKANSGLIVVKGLSENVKGGK